MCSGLCKIMLEEIPFLSEHVGLFRRGRHVEISEPVKLLLVNKIYEANLYIRWVFGVLYLLPVIFGWDWR